MPPTVFIGMVVVLGVGAVGAVLWILLGSSDSSRGRLASMTPQDSGAAGAAPKAARYKGDAVPLITQVFESAPWWNDLQLQLIRGGWMLRPSEFIGMSLGAAILATGIGVLLFKSVGQGVFLGIAAAAIPYAMMKSRQQKRLRMLTSQVPDALDMLASSLRSGCALLRAMQVVRSQMHPPISEEFGRVVDEVTFGVPVADALGNLIVRTGSYDLELIVAAVQTQLTVGGNLAEIFDSIGHMIRQRVQLMGELQAATAEGRMSAGILLGMPFVMAFLISIINPEYLTPLFHQKMGLILLGIGGVLMVIGSLIIRKLIDIDL